MASEKTKLWDALGKTDPAHTKGFTRGGGFKGTAIKPMWSYLRMTEEFGPCGKGWGVNPPTFDVQECGDERLVFCTASIWYETRDQICFGVGGDKVIAKFSSGSKTDDEAFKKAYTDAITNALKMIGVGADVHMGKYDDNKYVNGLKEEFAGAANAADQSAQRRTSSAQLKRDGVFPEMMKDIEGCGSVVSLMAVRDVWSKKAGADKWPVAWCDAAAEEFEKAEKLLRKVAEREIEEAGDTFPGDRSSTRNSYVDNFIP